MRPSESYRGVRRNNRSHFAKSRKLVEVRLLEEYKGKWNCFPDIPQVREGRKPSIYGVSYRG